VTVGTYYSPKKRNKQGGKKKKKKSPTSPKEAIRTGVGPYSAFRKKFGCKKRGTHAWEKPGRQEKKALSDRAKGAVHPLLRSAPEQKNPSNVYCVRGK